MGKVAGACLPGFMSLYEALGAPGHLGVDLAEDYGKGIFFDIDAGPEIEWEMINISSMAGGYGVLIRSIQPVPLDMAPRMPEAQFKMVKQQYDELGGKVHLMRYFGHMQKRSHLKDSARVKTGDLVGLVGTSGASTGPHVHRHLLVCNPADKGPFFYIDGDSLYKGRVDESKWFENTFVLDAMKGTPAGEDTEHTEEEINTLQLSLIGALNSVIRLYEALILLKQK